MDLKLLLTSFVLPMLRGMWIVRHRGTMETISRTGFHSTVICPLNRFLFDSSEVYQKGDDVSVTLPKDDYRTIHAAKILSLRNGDTVRCGVVSCAEHGGLVTDDAVVQWIPEGKVKKAEILANGKPPGSLQLDLKTLTAPSGDQMPTPPVSLILALPRPLALGRMLPMISQMGVEKLVLTEARKVPKEYFGSHLFRKPELLTQRLIEGLCQAGDVRLPSIYIVRQLSKFLQEDLDELFPLNAYARAIAHPQRSATATTNHRVRDAIFPPLSESGQHRKMVIAVGPEGGWEESEELSQFTGKHGFQQVTLGSRVLRSDCAVVSLLGLAHDACHQETN